MARPVSPGSASVTVLIAAFNAAPFIHRAIRSALAQDPLPLEVLVVDDRSTDDTAAVVEEIARSEPRVRLLRLAENVGPSGARNAGLDAACGDWVAVLDADDAYLAGRLSALLATAQATGADVVTDNFFYYDAATAAITDAGLKEGPTPQQIDPALYVARAQPFGDEADWGLLKPMFRRAFLNERNLRYPVYSRHGEDFLFMMDNLLAGGRCVLDRRAFYLYTSRASGMSRTQIDYDAMAQQSRRLLQDPRVSSHPAICDELIGRIAAVQRLSAERRMVSMIAARNVWGVLRLALTDDAARRSLFKRAARRLPYLS
jgi:succinoglycan biosynthesis protein ExoO